MGRICEPAGIQTPSLLIRSQMLYSVKLQAQNAVRHLLMCKSRLINYLAQFA